ncbi:MAG: GNAT family N-acetyltransferase [Clostridiaceae bacterium]|nr:GNAT family N-acetyltransferase [Clostridiaceae bacterium]
MELLSEENFNANSLDEYERRHDVKKVYRKRGAEYVLVDMPYIEDWSLEEKREIAKKISGKDYISYIALDKGKVVGFMGLKKKLNGDYMILDEMYVSTPCRGEGIGRKLFNFGKAEAKKAGAKALYISACSSEETIAFYKAMGASLTDKPIKEMAEKEPCDLQMICKVE